MEGRPFTSQELTELYIEHKDMVYRNAAKIVGLTDAQDIVQEVFIKLARSGHKLLGTLHVKHWLLRVTKTTCLDLLNKRYKSDVSYDGIIEETGESLDMADEAAQAAFDNEEDFEIQDERIHLLPKALSLLKPPERDIIHWRHFEELSHKDIANKLDISEGNSKVKLSRAMTQLKKLLEEMSNDETE